MKIILGTVQFGMNNQIGKISESNALKILEYPFQKGKLKKIVDQFNLWIIEDVCHAPGGYFIDSLKPKWGNGVFSDLSVPIYPSLSIKGSKFCDFEYLKFL